MKNTKSIIFSVLTLALSLVILVGCMFTVSADSITFSDAVLNAYNTQKYGTVDKGITVEGLGKIYNFYPSVQYGNPDIKGHPNLNFELGWQYWVHNENFKINTEITKDGKQNKYLTILTEEQYKGCYTIKFTDSRIQPGDSIAVLYKWRNVSHSNDCEPKVMQMLYSPDKINDESTYKDEHQLVHYSASGLGDKVIWRADDDDDKEWHIALTQVYHNVLDPADTYASKYYFYLGMQSRLEPNIFRNTDFDDIQLVHYNKSSGLISDLDGNTLYNLNSLPKRDDPDYIWGDLSEKDPNAKIKVNVEDLLSGKIDLNQSVGNGDEDTDNSGIALWVWIVIAAGVVLVLAVAAVVIIVISKKKKAVTPIAPQEAIAEDTAEEKTEE